MVISFLQIWLIQTRHLMTKFWRYLLIFTVLLTFHRQMAQTDFLIFFVIHWQTTETKIFGWNLHSKIDKTNIYLLDMVNIEHLVLWIRWPVPAKLVIEVLIRDNRWHTISHMALNSRWLRRWRLKRGWTWSWTWYGSLHIVWCLYIPILPAILVGYGEVSSKEHSWEWRIIKLGE